MALFLVLSFDLVLPAVHTLSMFDPSQSQPGAHLGYLGTSNVMASQADTQPLDQRVLPDSCRLSGGTSIRSSNTTALFTGEVLQKFGLFWSRDYIRHIRWQRQQAARQRREEEGQLTPSDASLTELSIVSSASSSPVYEPEPIYPPPQPAPRPAAAGYARQPVPPSALNADSSATVASSSRLRATTTVYHYFGDTRSALAGPSSTATIISEGSSASKSLPPPYASSEEVELPVYGTSRSFSRNAAVEAQNAFAAEDTDTSSRTGFEERRSSTPPTPRPRAPTPASEARMTTPMPSAAAPATPAMARRQRTFVLDPPATPIIRPQRARVAPHQRLRRERQALALERRYPILRTFQ